MHTLPTPWDTTVGTTTSTGRGTPSAVTVSSSNPGCARTCSTPGTTPGTSTRSGSVCRSQGQPDDDRHPLPRRDDDHRRGAPPAGPPGGVRGDRPAVARHHPGPAHAGAEPADHLRVGHDRRPPREVAAVDGDGEIAETADVVVSVPEIFNYWLQAGRIEVGFLGVAQIDRHANINTTVIGDYDHPQVRLPGAGGAPRDRLFRPGGDHRAAHSLRAFVDKLDFTTTPGHLADGGSRSELGRGAGRRSSSPTSGCSNPTGRPTSWSSPACIRCYVAEVRAHRMGSERAVPAGGDTAPDGRGAGHTAPPAGVEGLS